MIRRFRTTGKICFIGLVSSVLAGLLLFPAAWARRVTEAEPNDYPSQGQQLQCGDTVWCAEAGGTDVYDNFRFVVYGPDVLILTTQGCRNNSLRTTLVLLNEQDSVLAIDYMSGPDGGSRIEYPVAQPATLCARVSLLPTSQDTAYHLAVQCRLPGPQEFDVCTQARVIPGFPYYDVGTTRGTFSECGTSAPDVFYRFHNPVASDYRISVCTGEFDARVQILRSCCGGFGDDESEGCELGAVLTTYGLEEGDYYLLVEGTSLRQIGDFTLTVEAVRPECPAPGPVVLGTVGGLPFLDWPELEGPSWYVVWAANGPDGVYEHVGLTTQTFFQDNSGFVGPRRFYRVSAICPW